MNEEQTLVRAAIDLIDAKKGENIVIVDLTDVSIPTSYFVIAEADNSVHLKAIASDFMKSFPASSRHREGWSERRWVVLDYGDIVVHLFQKDARAFYDIESLWGDHIVSMAEMFTDSESEATQTTT